MEYTSIFYVAETVILKSARQRVDRPNDCNFLDVTGHHISEYISDPNCTQ